jgi:hypothetical protein
MIRRPKLPSLRYVWQVVREEEARTVVMHETHDRNEAASAWQEFARIQGASGMTMRKVPAE